MTEYYYTVTFYNGEDIKVRACGSVYARILAQAERIKAGLTIDVASIRKIAK